MAGFYGNIAYSNKTAITFDRIYTTRSTMDNSAAGDGVFINRYVLIDYDESPVQGYRLKDSQGRWTFWTTQQIPITLEGQRAAEITGIVDQLYLDLIENRIYKYTNGEYVVQTSMSGYISYYNTDVARYGRGYDSTVWQKTYNATTQSYKYVMIAELNTVVPNFHLVAEEPAMAPISPYFDSNVTNLDYYMHVQVPMGFSIRERNNSAARYGDMDDVIIKNVSYIENNTSQDAIIQNKTISPAFYLFTAGFNPNIHSTPSTTINSLGFDYQSSGRRYGRTPFQAGHTADDIAAWYIQLPAIGSAISTFWDTFYSEHTTRKRSFLRETNTASISGVGYTTSSDSMMGVINQARQYMGIVHKTSDCIGNGSNIKSNKWIGYTDSETSRTYYLPTYTNTWTQNNNGDYFLDSDGAYKLVNATRSDITSAMRYNRAQGTSIAPYLRWVATMTGKTDGESGAQAIAWDETNGTPQTIYGAIAYINRLTGATLSQADSRDDRTVIGLMNRMRDLISNIDTQLEPNRWLKTDAQGVMTTSSIVFKEQSGVTNVHGKIYRTLLSTSGDWDSRFAEVNVTDGENTAVTQMTIAEGGVTSICDPATEKFDSRLNLETANKWIRLAADNTNKTIKFAHVLNGHGAKSPTISTTNGWSSSNSNWDTTSGQSDNAIIIPTISWDEAGHIIGSSTQTFYLPYNFKRINVNAYSGTSVADSTCPTTKTTITADRVTDDAYFESENYWITIVADADNDLIKFGHRAVTTAKQVSPNQTGWGNTGTSSQDNAITFPVLTWDEAGHIIADTTTTFYLPNSFKYVAVGAQSTEVTNSTSNTSIAQADNSADTLTLYTANKWLTIAAAGGDSNAVDNDSITFGHITSGVTAGSYGLSANETISTLDTDNIFEVPYFTVDEAGHVTAAITNTVALPESFSKITIAAHHDDTVSELVVNTASVEADSLIDELILQSGNRWIRLAADATTDTIQFAHVVVNPNQTTPIVDFNNIGTFTADEITWDEAGHITSRAKTTYTLPYGFKTINVSNSTAITDITANNSNIIAISQVDAATLAAGNKWIKFAADDKTITVAHALSDLTATTIQPSVTDSNLSDVNTGSTITLPIFDTDDAGHIVATSTITYYIPYGFKTTTVAAQSNAVTNLVTTDTATSITASTIIDTATIATANKWIGAIADSNTKTISFGHLVQEITTTSDNTTFNDDTETYETDFEVPVIAYDEAGHITSVVSHNYKLPYGFKTIAITNDIGTSTITPVTNLTNCVATSVIDTLSLIGGNKWIGLTAENNAVSIGHLTIDSEQVGSKGDDTDQTPDFGETFKSVALTIDEAGHVTSLSEHTVTIPSSSAIEQLIQDNADAIQNNTDAIQNNTNTIQDNADAIQNNTNAIQDNTNAIATNADNIDIINTALYGDPEDEESIGFVGRLDNLEAVDIQAMIQTAIADLFANYNFTLLPPNVELTEENGIITAQVTNIAEDDTINFVWYQRATEDADYVILPNENTNTFNAAVINPAPYSIKCAVERIHNSHTSKTNAEIILPAPEPIEEPEPEPEP